MHRSLMPLLCTLLAWSGLPGQNLDEFKPPAGSGWVVVSEHGCPGDGATDVTQAMCKLPFKNKHAIGTMFFPHGTYLVSDTVFITDGSIKTINKRLVLQGESREGSVIRLADNAPGFQDPKKPKAVISFSSPANKASTGQAFGNSLYNLTVDVGKGNPGAIAVAYINNNQGCIRNCAFRSSDPAGAGKAGLGLTMDWPGPGLVADVKIHGFDYGILSTCSQYSMVFDRIELKGQRVAGISDQRQMLRIRRLTSENAVPALQIGDSTDLLLLDSRLGGGGREAQAIVGKGGNLYLNKVVASGYAGIHASVTTPEAGIAVSRPTARFGTATGDGPAACGLKDQPEVPLGSIADWVRVNGAAGDTPAKRFQQAIDGGAKVLYFDEDEDIVLEETVTIRGPVERIMGMGGSISGGKSFAGTDRPLMRIEGEGDRPLLIDRVNDLYGKQQWSFEIATTRPVIIRNAAVAGIRSVVPGARIWLDDVVGQRTNRFHFEGASIHARQFNPESKEATNITLDKSALWVLGLKTEYGQTVLDLRNGSSAEVYGCFSYHTGKQPWFILGGGSRVAVTNPNTREAGYATWFRIEGVDHPRNPGTLLLAQ